MLDLLKYPRRNLRRSWDRLAVGLSGAGHRRALDEDMPGLSLALAAPSPVRSTLEAWHAEYVAEVSRPEMAMSLETALFLWSLCDHLSNSRELATNGSRPSQLATNLRSVPAGGPAARLVDLGSGFSSAVFRLFAAEHAGSVVYSVDDDPRWLEATGRYLRSKGLRDDNLVDWDRFCNWDLGRFDLVFHDLGGGKRVSALDRVLPLARDGRSVVVFDDTQRSGYRKLLVERLREPGCRVHDTRFCTLDRFGRWSLLADFRSASLSCPVGIDQAGARRKVRLAA
ncbi:MAG: class I SAM-dependent methyltransferase [Thermoguttaceae bacterium]